MRFVTYRRDGDTADRVGVLQDENVHGIRDVTRLLDLLGDDGTLLRRAGERALDDPAETVGLADVTLRAPIPRPPTMRDFMAFEQHVAGTMLNYGPDTPVPPVFYKQPIFYFSNPTAVVGPYDDVPMPPGTRMFDFELEMACVVGRQGRNLGLDEAADAIVGYAVLNDWSARDLQSIEMRGNLGPAKGKDSAATLGPCLVTPDELAPFASGHSFALGMEVEINGELFGSDRMDNVAWSFPQMVAYASRGTTISPGDLIGSGTCGMGCLAELWGRKGRESHRMLEVGDVVTMRIEHLGEISNRVVAGDPVRDIGPCHASPES